MVAILRYVRSLRLKFRSNDANSQPGHGKTFFLAIDTYETITLQMKLYQVVLKSLSGDTNFILNRSLGGLV